MQVDLQQLSNILAQIKTNQANLLSDDTLAFYIQACNEAYYQQAESLITDAEYDLLYQTLKARQSATAKAVVEKVNVGQLGANQQRHLSPMLSLENAFGEQDLRKWYERAVQALGHGQFEMTVEPKFDGASISLVYDDGQLSLALTRGDGIVGEVITDAAKEIKGIPTKLAVPAHGTVEIRGEVLFAKQAFEIFNAQRIEDGLTPLANPRNAASGTIRMLDVQERRKRPLEAVLYHLSTYPSEWTLDTHLTAIQWLTDAGCQSVMPYIFRAQTIDEVVAYCNEYEAKRDDLPYEIDGLVIKVNVLAEQEQMGMTAHHPRWATAYKFKSRQALATLNAVEFQVGRTGIITPVAKIEPTPLAGVVISSLSLFNEDFIRDKELHIGDKVVIERAGEVIPYVVRVDASFRTGNEQPVIFPKECPKCSHPLHKVEGEAAWRCLNSNCPAQVVERLIHFASKDAMDIRGLGEKLVQRFFELGIIKQIDDIYQLDWQRVKTDGGLRDKSAANLEVAIAQSKQQPLNRLIFALGIKHVGETMAKTLANAVSHVQDLATMSKEALLALDDVGPIVADSIVQFFADAQNVALLQSLEALGLNVINTKKGVRLDGQLSGKSFLFTGTLTQFKRADAEALVEANGGHILGSVSTKLDYLVVGEAAGSKLEKAKKLGTIQILTEAEFMELLQSTT